MDNVKIIYYWYDHLLLRKTGEAEKVQEVIKNHDYSTFLDYVNKYGAEYFPQKAYILSAETDEVLGFLDMAKEEAFRMVMCSEYECG